MVKRLMDRLPLNDGFTIPGIGYGTAGIPDRDVEDLVYKAIQHGYRLIDTASAYDNEEGVGRAIRRAIGQGISREDLFVVTKVWKSEMGYQETMEAFARSFERLGLDYIDLYLIHWPHQEEGKNLETWRALEELKESGRVRSIGVSNFDRGYLTELLEEARIRPAVNQIPINPANMNADLDDFCYSHNIVTMAYSPLGVGRIKNDRKLIKIGEKYGKSASQVALKWCVDRDVVPIPKTTNEAHMKENLDIFDFELSDEDMTVINNIDRKREVEKGRRDVNRTKRHGSLRR